MSAGLIAVLVIVVLLVVAAVVVLPGQLRRQRLRRRFGPEYERVADGTDRATAEKQLAEREQRHSTFQLRTLSATARDDYLRRWSIIQERFVDEPAGAIGEADRLVTEVMADRGYPTGDFDQQADDLSVRYADEVARYREAHQLVEQANGASTDDLRLALLGYRELVRSLATA